MKRQTEIYDLLYRLGVTANYIGFFYTASAVQLCLEQPERLLLVTKQIYPDVAKRFHTNWRAVERNIRTVGSIIWMQGRSELELLAGRNLPHRPCTAQLLSILSYSLLSSRSSVPPSLGTDRTEAFSEGDRDLAEAPDAVPGACGQDGPADIPPPADPDDVFWRTSARRRAGA